MEFTHHAYFYEGPMELLPELAQKARELGGFAKEGDPDVAVRLYEKFGIDEARLLRQSAALKAVSGKALFVLGIASITTEAQQALLKLFEEPQRGSIFVLLVPHGILLPTLLSRCLPFPETFEEKHSTILGNVKVFAGASYKERCEIVAELLDENGPREKVREFLNVLEIKLHGALPKAKDAEQILIGLENIALVRNYLSDRSPSLKMLLEHLAAAAPKI